MPIMPLLAIPEFVARWQAATLTERSAAQQHFIDLCDVLGQPHPATADPQGTFYTFERGVTKSSGGQGFADVWLRGHFAWEYKGPHKDLSAAYLQLLKYREDLENPPLLVVCDLQRFEVHTNFTGTAKRIYGFTLADLANPAPLARASLSALDILRALFTDPLKLRPEQTTAQVTEAAATEFARLADSLRKAGAEPSQAAHFLMRILFCLFAEDIGLLPSGLFTRIVEATRGRPDDFGKRLSQLFEAMASGGFFGADDIAHFNGGLFSDNTTLSLTQQDMAVLSRACKLDWSYVEPAIFGTLFERSLDPGKRSQLGAHYTSKDDILLIVEPVLMAPLRREWWEVKEQAEALVAKRDGGKVWNYARQQDSLKRLLMGFIDRLAAVRVLDPACGSGNFLYVALKLLLDLEKEVVTFAATNGVGNLLPLVGSQVGPEQLHGIELNAYAHELAQVVVWIGYIQWMRDNGFQWNNDPILKLLGNIKRMDAILAFDDTGRAVEPEWPEADVIIGNPPFLGGNRIRQGLGDEYVEQLFALYSGRIPRFSDLVCYWFERARSQLVDGMVRRVGLLATQGIRGGANRKVLERIIETGGIFWAQSDRNWILDGAMVHVSMVGFDGGLDICHLLDGRPVQRINADLTAGLDITGVCRLEEDLNIAFQGPSPKAPFDIDHTTAQAMLASSPNINGRPNGDVVRRVTNAADLVGWSRCQWTIDFGIMPYQDAVQYEKPFEYVKTVVQPFRFSGRHAMYAGNWWQYGRPRPEMRRALEGKKRYICTPRHAKHRIFVWVSASILANDATIVFAREDDYFFGVLQSRLHELWARGTGSQLREVESGFRYTPTTCFETFPFPWPPGKEPIGDARVEAIAEAARELVEKRDRWLNPPGASEAELKGRTLTNLYNQRPAWLDQLHRKLDNAVLEAYGWPKEITNEDILERLLALNLERSGG